MKPTRLQRAVLSLLVAHSIPVIAYGAVGGTIEGQVQDSKANRPLAGVLVTIDQTGNTVTTARDGNFAFSDVAPGTYTLVLKLPGQPPLRRQVTVTAQQTTHENVAMAQGASVLEQVTVLAQFTPASLARAAQESAPNVINLTTSSEMKKLPDVNTGEAVRRLPGVSLETDEGEGRYVNIRGLDSDLNSTTFGGLRLPPTNNASPFGGYRAVTFDSIPIGLVGAITVTKTNLPEQDAEALGGTIEITPKTAPRSGAPFLQGNIGTGWESLRKTGIADFSVSAGGRFGGSSPNDSKIVAYGDRPFSVVGTLAYYEDKRGIDDVEPAYLDNANNPRNAYAAIDQRYYQLNRKRHGYGLDFGYQPDASQSYYIRAFDAGHTEIYRSNHLTITPDGNAVDLGGGLYSDTLNGTSALQKTLRDEKETIRDRVFVAGGKNTFGDVTLDYRLGFTKGSYIKPYDYNSSYGYAPAGGAASDAGINYSLNGVDHTPNYTIIGSGTDYANPSNYTLNGFRNSSASNYDKETSFASNLKFPVAWGGFDDESFKVGGSVRLRKKLTSAQPYSYDALPAIALTSASTGGNITYYKNQYQNGPNITPGYLQGILGSGAVSQADVVNAAAQYLSVKENVYAAFGQYEMTKGKLGLVGGVRVEATRDRSAAFASVTDVNGTTRVAPISASHGYSNFFPGVQARYELEPRLLLRAAYSTTLARPGFNQSNASLSVDTGSGTVARGNPNLKPITADSFDVSIEKYLDHAGIVSFGLFDKEISNYIVASVTSENLANNGLFAGFAGQARVVSYANTSKAHARGFEFNYEQRFKQLPGILNGLGAGFNWTYVVSRFQIRPGEYSPLPSTSRNTVNATLFYERDGLNLRLATYYVSADLFAIAGPGTDIYNSARTALDFGSSYALNRNLTVYFNAKNLTDTAHRFHEGSSDRVFQREFYGRTLQTGLQFEF